jgi:hypothetical protein
MMTIMFYCTPLLFIHCRFESWHWGAARRQR